MRGNKGFEMNERIRQLAEQATTYIDPSANDGICWNFDKEKFAELIVKECSGVNYHSSFQDGEFHARELLEHFGVE